ncbi:MAG TPA: hypothetical protein VGD78_14855 [Chthoniobacterales bacterium]
MADSVPGASATALEMGHPSPCLVRIAPTRGWTDEGARFLAERLGRHLTRHFKRQVGIAPAAFRAGQ